MFFVKKLGRTGMWGTVSLIDEQGSFRGEARFETLEEAKRYVELYRQRMKKEVDVKVFEDDTPVEEKKAPAVKEKKPSAKKKKKKPRKKPAK